MDLESAIPEHLRTERSCPRRAGAEAYTPPYPSFVARHQPSVKRVVMAYFGIQFRDETADVHAALQALGVSFAATHGPRHWDRAHYIDEAGWANIVSIAYWDSPAAFDAWFATHGTRWTDVAQIPDGTGSFVEVLRPAVERYETLFSADDRAEGIAVLADGMSGMVQEHAYWGGMRERIPLSQTDPMTARGAPQLRAEGARRRVIPHENICLIRSGQDWSDTTGEERQMVLHDVEPVLRAGMDFLRDDGSSIGCFANRYMRVVDADGRELDKSFGMSWWDDIASLERWAESHPTHVAIFGAAMQYLMKLGPAARLKLYHEVSVARADEQFFEYLNCHDRTGMLRACR